MPVEDTGTSDLLTGLEVLWVVAEGILMRIFVINDKCYRF